MAKLTSKAYAKLRTYFAADAPILRSVRGVLKRACIADYRKHLSAKYR
jgi:hypothetical protein